MAPVLHVAGEASACIRCCGFGARLVVSFPFTELEAIALRRIGSGIVTPAWKGSEINDPLCAVCLRGIFSCSFH